MRHFYLCFSMKKTMLTGKSVTYSESILLAALHGVWVMPWGYRGTCNLTVNLSLSNQSIILNRENKSKIKGKKKTNKKSFNKQNHTYTFLLFAVLGFWNMKAGAMCGFLKKRRVLFPTVFTLTKQMHLTLETFLGRTKKQNTTYIRSVHWPLENGLGC